MRWLKKVLVRWLLSEHEARLRDLERHFVTKRDADGKPIETLADVPIADRKKHPLQMRGMTMAQRKAWLEETDGGRNVG